MLQLTTRHNSAVRTFEVENNPTGRKPMSLIGPSALAAALAVEAFFALTAKGCGWLAGLSATAFALTAVLGVLWQTQARASRRLTAALDAYASQEIARGERSKPGKSSPIDLMLSTSAQEE